MVAILNCRSVAFARETDARLLRGLLRTISRATITDSDQRLETSVERVLLDAAFDGDRYVLIKLPLARERSLSLSPRQWQIVRLVAQGQSNKRIAAQLNLSLCTVGTHIRRMFAKLGVRSRAAMVARLLEADEGGDPRQADGGAILMAGAAHRDLQLGKLFPIRRERLQ